VWDELLELTRVRLHAGAISEADVVKAETAALVAAQDASAAAEDATTARADLAYLLGVRGVAPLFTVDAGVLALAPRPALVRAQPARLLARAREVRPDLKAAAAQVAAAESGLTLAHRQRFPAATLSVQGAGQGQGQDAIAPPTLTVGLALVPPLLYQYQGEIGRARAERSARRLELAKVEAQVATEVESARAAYAATSERVVRARDALVPSARRARDIVRIQYEKGAASFLELLDAQRTFIEVQRDALLQAADHAVALFQVERAVGREDLP
jgi:cobalt-zinc-cadmium efflux system outer membrane protein